MAVLTGITGAVRSQIAGRVNAATSGVLRSGVDFLQNTVKEGATAAFNSLTKGKFSTTFLTYPSDVDSDPQQGHFIIFNINTFTPGKLKSRKTQGFGDVFSQVELELGIDGGNILDDLPPAPTAARGGHGRSILAQKPTSRIEATISLYMPPSVQVSYNVNYADQEVGTLAMLGSDAIKAFQNENGNLKAKLTAVKNNSKGGVKEGITNLLNASLDGVFTGARALQQIDSGKVITPRMEMMFEGVGRRSFSYTFNFIPKSAEEAKTIEEIIYTFKLNMMPKYDGDSTRRTMEIPNTFDITYMYQNQENGFINKISSCFLQKIDVQYGADRYTAHESTTSLNGTGTPPQKSQITLDFVEIETLSKDSIREGH